MVKPRPEEVSVVAPKVRDTPGTLAPVIGAIDQVVRVVFTVAGTQYHGTRYETQGNR